MAQELKIRSVDVAVKVGRQPMLTRAQWRSIAQLLHITNRECQILQCLFDKTTEAAVGQNLGISTHTVHSHLRRIYVKLAVGSRTQLITRIFKAYVAVT